MPLNRQRRAKLQGAFRQGEASDVAVLSQSSETLRQQVYSEEVFRYFLGVERGRSARSSRSFLLLLVEWDGRSTPRARFEPKLARKVFERLGPCLRDTDFLGWYRDSRVAGAVLTQLGKSNGGDVSGLVKQRVMQAFQTGFSKQMAARLLVRVYQVPPAEQCHS